MAAQKLKKHPSIPTMFTWEGDFTASQEFLMDSNRKIVNVNVTKEEAAITAGSAQMWRITRDGNGSFTLYGVQGDGSTAPTAAAPILMTVTTE